jgi:hypothetical protein
VTRRDHDAFGQAHALTLLAPVDPGRASDLAATLDALPGGAEGPLARVHGTHFARWVLLDQLVYQGPPQKRDVWKAPRLLFTSNFDGALDGYLEALRTGLGADGDAIFGHCTDYPGAADAQRWTGWMRARRVPSALFIAAYGDQTVAEVRTNLDLRSRLIAFALEAQELEPAALQARFNEVFPL